MDLHKHQVKLMTEPAYRRANTFNERAEMLVKARVNPFSDRKLLTREQSTHLAALLKGLQQAHDSDPISLEKEFRKQGLGYLGRTTDEATFASVIMPELKQDTLDYYGHRSNLTYQPEEMPLAERIATAPTLHPHSWLGRMANVTATGDTLALYHCFRNFVDRHRLSYADIGAACVGVKSHAPLSSISVSNAVSHLTHGKAIDGPFKYIAKEPAAFFAALEKLLAARGVAGTIDPDERSELCTAINKAAAEHQRQPRQRPGARHG